MDPRVNSVQLVVSQENILNIMKICLTIVSSKPEKETTKKMAYGNIARV